MNREPMSIVDVIYALVFATFFLSIAYFGGRAFIRHRRETKPYRDSGIWPACPICASTTKESWRVRAAGPPCSDDCMRLYRKQQDDAYEARKAAEKEADAKRQAQAVIDSQPYKELSAKVDHLTELLAGHGAK